MAIMTSISTRTKRLRSFGDYRSRVFVGLLVAAAVAIDGAYVFTTMGGGIAAACIVPVVLGFHGLRAQLPFAAAARSFLPRVLICIVWLILTLLSFIACTGFLASVRDAAVTDRLKESDDVQRAKARLKQDHRRLESLGEYRDPTVIEAQLASALSQAVSKLPVTGRSLRACEPPAPTNSMECRKVFDLKTELAAARSADKIKAEIETSEHHRSWAAKTIGADPQSEILARLTTLRVETIQDGVVIMIAAMVEICAALGPWLLRGCTTRTINHSPQNSPPGPKLPSSAERPFKASVGATTERPNASTKCGNVIPIRGQVEWFVRDCLEHADGAFVNGGEIIAVYAGWCRDNGLVPLRQNDLMPAIKALTATAPIKGSKGRMEYRGLRLKAA